MTQEEGYELRSSYVANNTEITGEIKRQLSEFVRNSEVLDTKQKRDFIEEVGNNLNDDRFDATKFILDAISYSVHVWASRNFQLADMWKEVAINSSKISEEPDVVANFVVQSFKDGFCGKD